MAESVRIGVISDTHLTEPTETLLRIYTEWLEPCDYLVHCGDYHGEATAEFLAGHPGFRGVSGNVDGWDVARLVPPTRVFTALDFRIGVVHGWGLFGDVGREASRLFGPDLDLVCYGHTHLYDLREFDKTLVLNPGSLFSPRRGAPSLAIVTLTTGVGCPVVEKVEISLEGDSRGSA